MKKNIVLSAIIIAKNEEEMIEECIKSLHFCDEIIVIDTQSSDTTVEKAKKMGADVVSHVFINFAAARNFGKQQAKGEWILYIDADERVDNLLKDSILSAVQQSSIHTFKIERKNYYLGNHEWPKTEKLERLFEKKYLSEWYGELHESPRVSGSIGELKGFVNHYTHRTITEMLKKTIIWSETEALLRVQANHPPMKEWRFLRVMVPTFYDWYIKQGGWQLGTVGLIESIYQSFSIFITYARLWEMQQSKK